MNTAVRAAIEARIAELDARIDQTTQILTSYESQLSNLQPHIGSTAAELDQLEAEREELLAALPTEEEEE